MKSPGATSVVEPVSTGPPAATQAAQAPSRTRTSVWPWYLSSHHARPAASPDQSSYTTTGRPAHTPARRIADSRTATSGSGWRPPSPGGAARAVSMSTYAAPGRCPAAYSPGPDGPPIR